MIFDLGAALLRRLPAETAHRSTLKLVGMATPFLPESVPDDPRLRVDSLGLQFPNPLGLAAGFVPASAAGAVAAPFLWWLRRPLPEFAR